VYAWEVIKAVANEIEKTEVGSEPSSPVPEPVRRMSKETQDIIKSLSERRFTLARQTSTINEIIGRTSVDMTDDEVLLPRSRRGSLFPVCAFIDDFAEGTERDRRASLVDLGLDKLALGSSTFRRPSDSSMSGLRGGPTAGSSFYEAIIKEDEENVVEDGKPSSETKNDS